MSDDSEQAIIAQILELAAPLSVAAKARLIAALAAQLAQAAELKNLSAPDTAVGPLEFVQDPSAFPWIDILPNGIDAASGKPLLMIDALGASALAGDLAHPTDLQELHQARATSDSEVLGLVHGHSYDRLDEAGWAIVVSSEDDPALIAALEPLITHRCREQGLALPALSVDARQTCSYWLARQGVDLNRPMAHNAQVRLPIFTYRPGESCSAWLARHGVSARPVDPERGVPFYLLLVGRPGPLGPDDRAYIPFSFQYQLDLFWGVGRLCFTDDAGHHDLAAYAAYARHLVAHETSRQAHEQKRIVYFAPEHELDRSTQASVHELVRPLAEGVAGLPGLAAQRGFQQEVLLSATATRASLIDLLTGSRPCPNLLFTASHGVGFPVTDQRLIANQGALLCQDWAGYGSVAREHWFCADDVPSSSDLSGMIAILFGCYSLGCPSEDQFTTQANRPARAIAPHALVARLPQTLLRQGALAIFGHVDRAWTYSFRGHGLSADGSIARITYAQSQAFEDLLARIMDGKRLGYATDQFSAQQGAISSELAELLMHRMGRSEDDQADRVSLLWAIHNDLRGYALLGDPATRLRLTSRSSIQ